MARTIVYLCVFTLGLLGSGCGSEQPEAAEGPKTVPVITSPPVVDEVPPKPKAPLAAFVSKGLDWLLGAQHESGGWGAGSHAKQNIRDAHAVQTDPATTAFVGLAIIRAEGGTVSEAFLPGLLKATDYIANEVEAAPKGPKITSLSGTQPQTKLGPFVDTAMAAQFFARMLPMLERERRIRIEKALDICVAKLESSQQKNGSWGAGRGWAPVLQSSMGTQALELADRAGRKVSSFKLKMARNYQQGNVDASTGRAEASAAAGVELYAMGGASRASAPRARDAIQTIKEAGERGALPDLAPPTVANLRIAGVPEADARVMADAVSKMGAQSKRLKDETFLKGFGSNGGEEFLSYMLTSESLAIVGGKEWTDWNEKLHERLEKIQSADGSWTGHHCITSPVFCTAAVVQALTVERDIEYLQSSKAKAPKPEKNEPEKK